MDHHIKIVLLTSFLFLEAHENKRNFLLHNIRIEFFDDEIESIRFFDTRTQRGKEKIDIVEILPASDLLYDESEVNDVLCKIDELYEESINEEIEIELSENIELDKLISNKRMHMTYHNTWFFF